MSKCRPPHSLIRAKNDGLELNWWDSSSDIMHRDYFEHTPWHWPINHKRSKRPPQRNRERSQVAKNQESSFPSCARDKINFMLNKAK